MAYTKNPHMPTVRRDAVRLVKYRGWSTRKAARHLGYTHSAIVKWCAKDLTGGWQEIPTRSSRPKRSPHALSREVVNAIIKKRVGRRRCGQVIHRELLADGVSVSLCSVQRTLKRCHLLKTRSPWKRPHDATLRPEATHPGTLVQADTVHFLLPDGSHLYVYTLIDLFSRWAYAEVSPKLRAYTSARFLARAQKKAPFMFEMIQTDHGPEFSTRFTHILLRKGIAHRHSRVRQCNDNAHVERFNRTLQDECLAGVVRSIPAFKKAISGYLPYYINDRMHMGIDFKTPAQMLQVVPRS
ncbi:MAG: DDE-type integrase/transposase/recombinase [Parcubacteria group bacterium]|nr:DDE-type integrase/transposase/recombinase [Parcubacteria group bacterium]